MIQLVSEKRIQRDARSEGAEGFLFIIRERTTVPSVVPSEALAMLQKEFPNVLVTELPAGLPPEREVDHCIDILPGDHKVPNRPTYRMSPLELQKTRRQIEELLEKGYIRLSKLPYGAVIVRTKKNGTLQMCIDYQGLNQITKRNSYPLPRIDELLEGLAGAKVFSKLDLASVYHQVRIEKHDIEKTTFNSRYGHYE